MRIISDAHLLLVGLTWSRSTSADSNIEIKAVGITPMRMSFRSPSHSSIAERWVGTYERELIDHVVVLGKAHLRRLLRYYDADRIDTRLTDAPKGRLLEARSSFKAELAVLPRVGGLHHQYVLQEAA